MILAWLAAVPRWAKIAAAVAMLCVVALTLHQCAINRAVRADRAETAAEAHKTAREADAASRGAVDDTRARVEAENQAARDAAAGSDDKLKAAMDSLRKK